MLPTLKPGQDVVSFNWALSGKPKAGDIIVIRHQGREIVKRVQKTADRQVFVQGDNKEESTDSRDFGLVDISQVIGKVVFHS